MHVSRQCGACNLMKWQPAPSVVWRSG